MLLYSTERVPVVVHLSVCYFNNVKNISTLNKTNIFNIMPPNTIGLYSLKCTATYILGRAH